MIGAEPALGKEESEVVKRSERPRSRHEAEEHPHHEEGEVVADESVAEEILDELDVPAGVPVRTNPVSWVVAGLLFSGGLAACVVYGGVPWGLIFFAVLALSTMTFAGQRYAEAPGFMKALGRLADWSPWPVWFVLLVSLVVSTLGSITAHKSRSDQIAGCIYQLGLIEDSFLADNYLQAKAAIDGARKMCDSDRKAEIDGKVLESEKRQATFEKRRADLVVAKGAEAAARRERAAVEDFPEEAKRIRASVKRAVAAAARNDMPNAAPSTKSARLALDEFKGTSIEKTAEYQALDAQLLVLEKKVQPYLDEVNAMLAKVQKNLAEETLEDRRNHVKYMEKGFIATVTLDALERAQRFAIAGDKEGLTLLVEHDPDVIMLDKRVKVTEIERGGLRRNYVHVRVRGTLTELWTIQEALKDP